MAEKEKATAGRKAQMRRRMRKCRSPRVPRRTAAIAPHAASGRSAVQGPSVSGSVVR